MAGCVLAWSTPGVSAPVTIKLVFPGEPLPGPDVIPKRVEVIPFETQVLPSIPPKIAREPEAERKEKRRSGLPCGPVKRWPSSVCSGAIRHPRATNPKAFEIKGLALASIAFSPSPFVVRLGELWELTQDGILMKNPTAPETALQAPDCLVYTEIFDFVPVRTY
jgi:hypothetical protein